MTNAKTVPAYISAQPKELRAQLLEMYAVIQKTAPKAKETISYGMPTFTGVSNMVHFAAMKRHLGFYPGPEVVAHFSEELSDYSTSKGCVRFLYNKPLPKSLIAKMVRFGVKADGKEK